MNSSYVGTEVDQRTVLSMSGPMRAAPIRGRCCMTNTEPHLCENCGRVDPLELPFCGFCGHPNGSGDAGPAPANEPAAASGPPAVVAPPPQWPVEPLAPVTPSGGGPTGAP